MLYLSPTPAPVGWSFGCQTSRMESRLYPLLLVFLLPSVAGGECLERLGDLHMRMSAYSVDEAEGVSKCGQTCALEGRCVAINFHSATLICELVEAGAVAHADSFGWTYITNFDFVTEMLGPCSGETVPDNLACVKLTGGGKIAIIKYCPELPPIIHASLTSDSRKVGVTVTYTCDAGYAGIGDDQRKCVGNGQWKGSTFECRDCGPPPDIPFGTVQPGDNLVGTDRFYLCGVLSTPDANAFITCQTDGQWSTATFTCVCPDPPSVPNASPSSSDKVVGTVITFTCDTGYVATGTSSITCLSTGAWESLTFTCTEARPVVNPDSQRYSADILFNDYQCVAPVHVGGTDCGDPPTVSGTSVQSGSNLVGSDRFYLCDTHANVLSNNYRTCQDTGEWSTTPISCGTWPNAVFSLLQPTTGCPTGFLSGSRTWHTEEFGSSSRSENFLAGYASGGHVEWHFCSKTDPTVNTGPAEWPAGTYCILRYTSTCPTGFNSGYIFFDEEDDDVFSRPNSGQLPWIVENVYFDSLLYFCCRSDGPTGSPMTMSSSDPFVLFAFGSETCQSVQGKSVTPGYTYFDSEDFQNMDSKLDSTAYALGPPNWSIFYCLYS